MIDPAGRQGLPAEYFTTGSSSFVDLLSACAPEQLPVNRVATGGNGRLEAAHGTTVLALIYADGVMMAGDRRVTMGNAIAQRDAEKVRQADEHSVVAFAGTMGFALEMVRLFQTELAHYEKMEATTLSLNAKARRLGAVVRANLGLAMQGLAVVPLFAGYDLEAGRGRIFDYDISGAPNETKDFYAEGSGSPFARGALKKLYTPGMPEADAARACVQALYDAADDDTATGGPDVIRKIYPVISVVTADGYRRLPEDEVAAIAEDVVRARHDRPEGPVAPLG